MGRIETKNYKRDIPIKDSRRINNKEEGDVLVFAYSNSKRRDDMRMAICDFKIFETVNCHA